MGKNSADKSSSDVLLAYQKSQCLTCIDLGTTGLSSTHQEGNATAWVATNRTTTYAFGSPTCPYSSSLGIAYENIDTESDLDEIFPVSSVVIVFFRELAFVTLIYTQPEHDGRVHYRRQFLALVRVHDIDIVCQALLQRLDRLPVDFLRCCCFGSCPSLACSASL